MRSQLTLPAVAMALGALITGCSPEKSASIARDRAAADAAAPAAPANRQAALRRVVPGEFLVKFKSGTSKEHIARTLAKVTPSSVRSFKALPGLRRVTIDQDLTSTAFAGALGQSAQLEYVEPNFIVHVDALPNDPEFGRQWNMHNLGAGDWFDADIDAPEAWDVTTGSDNIVVGVIDSGVDYTHEDLAANIFSSATECTANGIDDDGNGYVDDCHGIDAITGSSNPMDSHFHGTHVAGIIGAVGNNGIGVAGVAWHVRILPCKFINSEGEGTTADAIACIDYMADLKDRGVNIVATNNSWGGLDESRALRDAIATHRQRGILFVVAAGNDREDNDLLPSFPCSHFAANVVCVGATGINDFTPSFTNWGRGTVHLSAPGEGILSTVPNNGYDYLDGTSMATPHVTGAVALLAAQNPARDWRATKNLIIAGGDLLPDVPLRTQSNRRLNVAGSLSCTNSVVLAKLQPLTPTDFMRSPDNISTFRRPIGTPIPLSALHINCAAAAGPVTVSVAPSGELVTLLDDGTGIDEAAGDGIYSATWTPQSAGTFVLSFDIADATPVTIEVDARLKPGFPQPMTAVDFTYDDIRNAFGSSTVVGNIDDDPRPEILATGISYGPLYAWHHDGSGVLGWPAYLPNISLPSLGELDGDPANLEVVTNVWIRGLMVLDGDGARLPGWPRQPGAFAAPPTIDVDGDGLDEIIDFPARHADGSLLSPLRPVPVTDPSTGGASTADLDGDGEPDFVSAYLKTLWASSRNGMLAGFPAHSDIEMGPGTFASRVAIGDVDGDGHLELVAVAYEYPDWLANVLVFSDKGQLERTLHCSSSNPSMPALADLDGDGIPEILVSTNSQVYAWKGDGSLLPGWPVSLGTGGGGGTDPIVGDVDGDGQPDVVVALQLFQPYRTARLHIFDRHGTPFAGLPLPIETSTGMIPPAIADLDLDGRNDLVVVTTPDWGRRDGVFAFDWHGPGPYGPIEWGQHLGDARHRGYYELGKNLTQDAYLTTLAHGEGSITTANGDIHCGDDCIQRYRKGASVTLVATATAQGRFNRWMGACAGQGNPCTIGIQHYTRVAAQFDTPLNVAMLGSGTGTVTSIPAGISCPGDCSQLYDARTVVTLTATPAALSAFDGWGGACSGKETTCTVPIDRAQSVTAKFVTHFGLSVASTGTGTGLVTSEPAGILCGTQCSTDFPVNTTVTLTVTPAADSTFTGWTVPCPFYLSKTCTLTMDQARTMTATFARKVALNVSRIGPGHGRVRAMDSDLFCGSVCSALFDANTVTQAFAEPEFDSYFVEWTGACTGSNNSCLLIMNSDMSTTARFALKPVLRVTANGSGSVQSSDGRLVCQNGTCQTIYEIGVPVTLTAIPGANSAFLGWGGACSGQSSTCSVTLTSAKDVTASFTAVSSPPPPPSGGSATGGGGGGGSQGILELLLLLGLARRASRARFS